MKSALQLLRRGKSNYLQIHFAVRASRVVNNPLYWYLPVGNPLGKSVASQHENRLRLHGEKGPHATPPSLQT